MTVPQGLSFSAQRSNCNLVTCLRTELGILSLLQLSISIHLRINFSCSMKFFQLKITLGRILAVPWATAEKNWCLQRPASVRRLLQANLHVSPLAKTRMWTQGSNLDCTTILRQSWEELLPWERTPWHWSKHFQFRPIMTVPQRLSFSELLSNCNLATSWRIELSILGLLHLSISIHLRISFFYEVLSIENNPWAGLGRILAVACANVQCLSLPYFAGRLS